MDAATIEEANRIRVSLGMKPLPVPGADTAQDRDSSDASDSDGEPPASTLETRQAQAYDNYASHMEAEAQKKKREERAAAIRKAREKAQRFAAIEGHGLGEADKAGELDTKSWLMGQKKRQKKIEKARKLEEELAAAEAAAAAAVQYTSKDLAGIKVAHDSSAFLEGNDQILTLKDTTIDENEEEGDELENLDLRDKRNSQLDWTSRSSGPATTPTMTTMGSGEFYRNTMRRLTERRQRSSRWILMAPSPSYLTSWVNRHQSPTSCRVSALMMCLVSCLPDTAS